MKARWLVELQRAGCALCSPISFMSLHILRDTFHDPALSIPQEVKCRHHRDSSQPFNQQHSEAHRVNIQMGKNSNSEYLSHTNSPSGILDSKNR